MSSCGTGGLTGNTAFLLKSNSLSLISVSLCSRSFIVSAFLQPVSSIGSSLMQCRVEWHECINQKRFTCSGQFMKKAFREAVLQRRLLLGMI